MDRTSYIQRLGSFKQCKDDTFDAIELADEGFSYKERTEKITCDSCGVQWSKKAIHANNCSFHIQHHHHAKIARVVPEQMTANHSHSPSPVNKPAVKKKDVKPSTSGPLLTQNKPVVKKKDVQQPSTSGPLLTQNKPAVKKKDVQQPSTSGPLLTPNKHPTFNHVVRRIQTFTDAVWSPAFMRRKSRTQWLTEDSAAAYKRYADAGFFAVDKYHNASDPVICYVCGVNVRGFSDDDDPWKEHASWAPHCTLLRANKDAKFIAEIQESKKRHNERRAALAVKERQELELVIGISKREEEERIAEAERLTVQNNIAARAERDRLERDRRDRLARAERDRSNRLAKAERDKTRAERDRARAERDRASKTERDEIAAAERQRIWQIAIEEDIRSRNAPPPNATPQPSTSNAAQVSVRKTPQSVNDYVYSMFENSYNITEIKTFHAEFVNEKKVEPNGEQLIDFICNKKKALYSSNPDDNICVVCMSEPFNHVFIPCGHLCCCQTCSDRLKDCPRCRGRISKKLKVYF
ncbi:E3 ubiquitin-protein ligase MUL1 [Mytilus galloprovincialis]|uniref:E3 ubiquitin-protein ligase MUL1 n=1 Tax=Mytilus galloprovincialis TaxID=29158 RepID=A0A8B6E3U6_MYTGA|nr:E3 ubiquitin-protein ligase MUL1 [Mytilus galloprovincialis]